MMDFEYTFVIEDYASHYGFMCTEDCGSGLIWFTVEDLKRESYAVWVGGIQIGDVQVPSEPICLDVDT
jgi:3-methyladenine DNA glycosylase Tag